MGRSPSSAAKSAAASAPRLHALARLCHAWETAREVAAPAWEFACQLPELRADGVTDTDLRWLLARGYAEHHLETTKPGQRRRRFRLSHNARFLSASCFVLTPTGRAFAATLKLDWTRHAAQGLPAPKRQRRSARPTRPRWDPDRRILWLGHVVVKRFRLEAKNQELILAAFEEERWPVHLDDPLPPRPDVDPKRRLHDTIKRLNRYQKPRCVHFEGDGTGRGIRWHRLTASAPFAPPQRP
jgi:hypothetical protein